MIWSALLPVVFVILVFVCGVDLQRSWSFPVSTISEYCSTALSRTSQCLLLLVAYYIRTRCLRPGYYDSALCFFFDVRFVFRVAYVFIALLFAFFASRLSFFILLLFSSPRIQKINKYLIIIINCLSSTGLFTVTSKIRF